MCFQLFSFTSTPENKSYRPPGQIPREFVIVALLAVVLYFYPVERSASAYLWATCLAHDQCAGKTTTSIGSSRERERRARAVG